MAKFLNLFFIAVTSFFLCFCWLAYYNQPLWVRYLLGLLFSIMLFFLLLVLQKKANLFPNKKSKKNLKAQKYALALLTDYDIFIDVFKQQGYQIEKVSDNSYCLLGDKKTLINFVFRLNNLGTQDLINAFKQAKKIRADKIVIFCISVDSSMWQFQSNFPLPVFILDFDASIRVLANNGKSIKPYYGTKKGKFFDKNFFYFAFAKNRSKHYFAISVFLLLMAIVSYYPIYNIIVATVCFGLGIYSLVNKRFNPNLFIPML